MRVAREHAGPTVRRRLATMAAAGALTVAGAGWAGCGDDDGARITSGEKTMKQAEEAGQEYVEQGE